MEKSEYYQAVVAVAKYEILPHLTAEQSWAHFDAMAVVCAYEAQNMDCEIYLGANGSPITTIPEMLRFKMYALHTNQRELAKRLEVTENRLSEILSGKREVNIDFAKRMQRVLNVSANFILKHS
jgi:HTH-type transcriptional regulator/antitoxin HigA